MKLHLHQVVRLKDGRTARIIGIPYKRRWVLEGYIYARDIGNNDAFITVRRVDIIAALPEQCELF